MSQPVAISGMGAVSPIGLCVTSSWENAKSGNSGIQSIPVKEGVRSSIAGIVNQFHDNYMSAKDVKKYDAFIRYAYEATYQAIKDAQLDIESLKHERVAILITSGIGGLRMIQENCLKDDLSPRRVSPFFIPGSLINMAAGVIATEFGFKGPSFSPVSACASSSHSLAIASMLIETDQADVVIAGGAESTIDSVGMSGFGQMRALSQRNDDPAGASRPWDKGRDGFVLSDGAGILVLESQRHLKQRNGRAKAYLSGYGMTSDGYHITSPDPNGDGAGRAMSLAMKKANLQLADIAYINAHATSTPMGDQTELKALQHLSGGAALEDLRISSTKSIHGHLLGAAGAFEAILTIKAMEHQIVPPTINLHEPENDFGFHLSPHHSYQHEIRHAMSNSFGFGGTNASLIFTHESAI